MAKEVTEEKDPQMKTMDPGVSAPKQEKIFNLSKEGKEAILEILKTKPYVEVYPYTSNLSRDEFTESEANAIINFIGKYPFIEVHAFFAKMNEYFTEVSPEQEPEPETKK